MTGYSICAGTNKNQQRYWLSQLAWISFTIHRFPVLCNKLAKLGTGKRPGTYVHDQILRFHKSLYGIIHRSNVLSFNMHQGLHTYLASLLFVLESILCTTWSVRSLLRLHCARRIYSSYSDIILTVTFLENREGFQYSWDISFYSNYILYSLALRDSVDNSQGPWFISTVS